MSNSSNRLIIFDTTLRDGEQSPGASMTKDEKLRIAQQLERLRVDVIEAGFAAASHGDFEAIRAIAAAVASRPSARCRAPTTATSRAPPRRWSRPSASASTPSSRPRRCTWRRSCACRREQVLEQAKNAVRFARKFTDDVEFSPEDGYRSDPDFLCRVLEGGDRRGRHHDQLPRHGRLRDARALRRDHPPPARAHPEFRQGDLVGALPQRPRHGRGQFAGRRDDRRRAPDRMHHQRPRRARRQHRAGRSRDGGAARARDYFDLEVGIDTTQIVPASQMVSQITGFAVQPNKAVVGANAFAHASGIHQDGVLKARETYEIMRAEDVGWAANKIVLGKLSGRNAFKQRLQELGIELDSEADINAAFAPLQGAGRPQVRDLRRGHPGAGVGRAAVAGAASTTASCRWRSAPRPARRRRRESCFPSPASEHSLRRRGQRPGRRDRQRDRIARCAAAPSWCCSRSTPSAAAPSRRAR